MLPAQCNWIFGQLFTVGIKTTTTSHLKLTANVIIPLFLIYCSCFLALFYSLAFLSLKILCYAVIANEFLGNYLPEGDKNNDSFPIKRNRVNPTKRLGSDRCCSFPPPPQLPQISQQLLGDSATLRRLRVDSWVWRRVELWPPLLPSLHVMPSCSQFWEHPTGGYLFFLFVFPKAIREIRTSKQWSDSREMDSITFLLLFQLLPQNSSDKSPLPAKEIHLREHQVTAALNKIPHHGLGLTPPPHSPPLCPGFICLHTTMA